MYWHFEGFTAIYTQIWFKWYIICHAECTGPRAFWCKTFHIGWRQKVFWDRPRIQAMYKNDLKKSMMSCTDILKGLLQSTHNSGSNGISFVMLGALVPEPFDAKLFILVDGWNFFGIGRGFRRCTKMTIRIEICHILKFLMVYCNLYIIMVQIIYNLSSWVPWSQSLSTQNFRHKHTHTQWCTNTHNGYHQLIKPCFSLDSRLSLSVVMGYISIKHTRKYIFNQLTTPWNIYTPLNLSDKALSKHWSAEQGSLVHTHMTQRCKLSLLQKRFYRLTHTTDVPHHHANNRQCHI